jgi:hypothetical protein
MCCYAGTLSWNRVSMIFEVRFVLMAPVCGCSWCAGVLPLAHVGG